MLRNRKLKDKRPNKACYCAVSEHPQEGKDPESLQKGLRKNDIGFLDNTKREKGMEKRLQSFEGTLHQPRSLCLATLSIKYESKIKPFSGQQVFQNFPPPTPSQKVPEGCALLK